MKFETTFQTEPKQDSLKAVRCEKGIFNLEKNDTKRCFTKRYIQTQTEISSQVKKETRPSVMEVSP